MLNKRILYETLEKLARRIEALGGHTPEELQAKRETGELILPPGLAPAPVPNNDEALGEIDKQVKRLSKELYKTNTLNESQADQTRKALEATQKALDELSGQRKEQAELAVQKARLEMIKALFPVLDGIEQGILSGAQQVRSLVQATPDAARTLAAWLNGQRLLRERILKLLEVEGVRPIPTVGQPFDPYRHVAVKIIANPDAESNIIMEETRAGYISGETVIRFAEVVVNKRSEIPEGDKG